MHQLLHLLLEVLAYALGYRYYVWLRSKRGDAISDDRRVWIIIGAAAGALVGSRLLGALEDPAKLAWNAKALFIALNNRTVVGGLLGGLAGVEITKKLVGEKRRTGDLFVFPLLLGMVVGRVGCMLGGLEDNTYGIATTLPWGIDLGDGVHRHPTNAYEIFFLVLLGSMLALTRRRFDLAPGALFKLFMVGYLLFRLWVESIKPDPVVMFGFSSIQIASLLGLLYYYRVWIRPSLLLEKQNA